jgi:Domain of unknown function (DUF4430)
MNEAKNSRHPVAPDADAPASASWWRLPLLLAVVLAAIVAARTTRIHEREVGSSAVLPQAEATGKTVSLEIRFGDGRERRFDTIPWFPGMTVDQLMLAASRLPDGVRYGAAGDHERMMLTNIDDSYNEWGGGRNWTYQVNGVPADRSIGIYELQPDDRVLWTFGKQQ